MHKNTSRDHTKKKKTKGVTHKVPKREILWGMVERERRAGFFIASVGSPSGRYIDAVRTRAASKRSRLVTRIRTINFNRPPDIGCARPDVKQLMSVRLSSIPVRTSRNYRPDTPH